MLKVIFTCLSFFIIFVCIIFVILGLAGYAHKMKKNIDFHFKYLFLKIGFVFKLTTETNSVNFTISFWAPFEKTTA